MIIHSIMTVLWFAVFIGVCFWAYSKKDGNHLTKRRTFH